MLEAQIIETKPRNMNAQVTFALNEIVIAPVLLNSKDSVIIKILLTKQIEDQFLVTGRIVGIDNIFNSDSRRRKSLSSVVDYRAVAILVGGIIATIIYSLFASFTVVRPLVRLDFNPQNSNIIIANSSDYFNFIQNYTTKLETFRSAIIFANAVMLIIFTAIIVVRNLRQLK